MIITITLALSFLVALNFLLLIFSCNKTTKRVSKEQPLVIKSVSPKIRTEKLTVSHLAPTGS